MKVLIVGSRTFDDYDYMYFKFKEHLIRYIDNMREEDRYADDFDIEIVSGGARGADRLAEKLAYELSLKIKVFHPDWKTHGRSAGIIRNQQMAEYCGTDQLALIFWDSHSKGTQDMIKKAKKHGLETIIFTDWKQDSEE